MWRKAILALAVWCLLFASAQAVDYLTPLEAQEVAQELADRIVSYVSAHPDKAGVLPQLRETRITDPVLVHRYPDLKPCYYVVPVVNATGQIVLLVGTSAAKQEWQWFTQVELEAFTQVSQDQAYLMCKELASDSRLSHLRVVEMPNKRLYWLCQTDAGNLKEIFVDIDDGSQVYTNLHSDISDLTTARGPIPKQQHPSALDQQRIEHKSFFYPESYNIEDVPFYYQETSWYCCEAALEMLFDYWGPDISQTDIGDVANDMPGVGTYIDDVRRASHFSYISTAIQNPLLQGYNERDLGYSSNEVWWSYSEHYPDRYDDLKNLISNDYPILVATWYSATHSAGHCRVVKGYDDWLGHFIVHDPWYGTPYSGPDVHFNQTFFVDNLWLYSDRWGMFSAPWKAELSVPRVISSGQIFTVRASLAYSAMHPFEGQFHAVSISASLSLPPDYLVVPPGAPTIELGSGYSGFVCDTSWQVLPLSSGAGPDTIKLETKGLISGSSSSYPSYEDWIGAEAEAMTELVLYNCGDANNDGAVNSSDVVYLLNYLYREGYPPSPLEAGDANLDSAVDGADVVYLLNYLFRDGPVPCE